jgi:hypothetical protein
MPDPGIQNPKFANSPPGASRTSESLDFWALDPNITIATLTALVPATLGTNISKPAPGVGAVVELQSWNGSTSGATGSPTYPTVALSATTADGSIVGVIDGGNSAGTAVATPGQVVNVVRYGIVKIIVDNTTVVGHALVQSTSTAGAAHDSGGVGGTQGETIGIALQALTVSSGLGMIYALVKLT